MGIISKMSSLFFDLMNKTTRQWRHTMSEDSNLSSTSEILQNLPNSIAGPLSNPKSLTDSAGNAILMNEG